MTNTEMASSLRKLRDGIEKVVDDLESIRHHSKESDSGMYVRRAAKEAKTLKEDVESLLRKL